MAVTNCNNSDARARDEKLLVFSSSRCSRANASPEGRQSSRENSLSRPTAYSRFEGAGTTIVMKVSLVILAGSRLFKDTKCTSARINFLATIFSRNDALIIRANALCEKRGPLIPEPFTLSSMSSGNRLYVKSNLRSRLRAQIRLSISCSFGAVHSDVNFHRRSRVLVSLSSEYSSSYAACSCSSGSARDLSSASLKISEFTPSKSTAASAGAAQRDSSGL
eukprot:IDg11263t1